jgi:hypothetical protein
MTMVSLHSFIYEFQYHTPWQAYHSIDITIISTESENARSE